MQSKANCPSHIILKLQSIKKTTQPIRLDNSSIKNAYLKSEIIHHTRGVERNPSFKYMRNAHIRRSCAHAQSGDMRISPGYLN